MALKLVILTPRKKFFEGEVSLLNIVTLAGETGVLGSHYPLISVIKTGAIHFKTDSETRYFATSGGVLSVQKDKTVLLLETIERPEDIDINRAEQAKLRAEKLLKDLSGETDILRAEAALSRALNRIDVYHKYRQG